MGTGMALLLATRSKLLAGALLIIIIIGDGFFNSLMTVLEHLVALLVGAATYLLLTHIHRHPDGDRTQVQRQAGLRLYV
jgi:xanthine/uracil permease